MFDWLLVKRQRKKVGDVLTVPNARGFFGDHYPLNKHRKKEDHSFIHGRSDTQWWSVPSPLEIVK
jgi:hypothetical protein